MGLPKSFELTIHGIRNSGEGSLFSLTIKDAKGEPQIRVYLDREGMSALQNTINSGTASFEELDQDKYQHIKELGGILQGHLTNLEE